MRTRELQSSILTILTSRQGFSCFAMARPMACRQEMCLCPLMFTRKLISLVLLDLLGLNGPVLRLSRLNHLLGRLRGLEPTAGVASQTSTPLPSLRTLTMRVPSRFVALLRPFLASPAPELSSR